MRHLTLFVLLLPSLTPLFGQESIAWRFKEEQQFFVEQKLVQSQSVVVAGQKKDSTTSQTSLLRFDVQRLHDDGKVDILMTVERVGHTGGPTQTTQLTKQMAGAEFPLTIGKNGKLVRLDGYSDFVKKIAAGDDRRATLFKAVLSEDSFKKLVAQTFEVGPGRTVEAGESWQHKLKLPLGPFGSIAFNRTMKFIGVATDTEEKQLKLNVSGTASYERPTGDYPGFPFKVTQGSFEFKDITGKATFDASANMLKSLEVQLQMNGKLTISIGNSQQDVTISQKQTSTLKVLSEKPALNSP